MKTLVILLFVFCYVESRKVVPIDKNANLAFINMEGGGGSRPATKTQSPPQLPTPAPTPVNKHPATPAPIGRVTRPATKTQSPPQLPTSAPTPVNKHPATPAPGPVTRPATKTQSPPQLPSPAPTPVNKHPATPAPIGPVTTWKVQVTTKAAPAVTPAPTNLVTPKKVNPPVVSNPITTPGPGSVKQLVNFYNSQGQASPIRPYSYSQAVKQG